MNSTYRSIPTGVTRFDRENPIIKVALEKCGDKLDDQRIGFARRSLPNG